MIILCFLLVSILYLSISYHFNHGCRAQCTCFVHPSPHSPACMAVVSLGLVVPWTKQDTCKNVAMLWWYHQRGNLKPFRARRSQEGYLASMLHARASAVEQGTICGCTHSTYQPSAAPATWGLIQPNWSQSQPWLWGQAGYMCFTSFACTCLIQAAFLPLAWCSTVWKYCILSDSDKCHDPLA